MEYIEINFLAAYDILGVGNMCRLLRQLTYNLLFNAAISTIDKEQNRLKCGPNTHLFGAALILAQKIVIVMFCIHCTNLFVYDF